MRSLLIYPTRARWVPRLDDTPPPGPPRGRQVQIQVEQVGICGMDRALLLRHEGIPPDPERWVVGHEMVGRVTGSGREVRKIKPGDWVVPVLRRPCKLCAPCAGGNPEECTTTFYIEPGLHRAHGWASQWAVDHEEHLVVISPAIVEIALLAEPLALAVKGAHALSTVQRRTLPSCSHFEHRWDQPRWPQDKHLLVAGASPLTLLLALYLRYLGSQVTLYATQSLPQTLQAVVAKDGIAIVSHQPQEGVPLESVEQVDGLLDTSGDPLLVTSLLPKIRPNGVVVSLIPLTAPSRRSHDQGQSALFLEALHRGIALVPCYRIGRPHIEQAVEWLESVQTSQRFPFPLLLDKLSPPSQFDALVRSPQPWLKSRITLTEPPKEAPAV